MGRAATHGARKSKDRNLHAREAESTSKEFWSQTKENATRASVEPSAVLVQSPCLWDPVDPLRKTTVRKCADWKSGMRAELHAVLLGRRGFPNYVPLGDLATLDGCDL